MINRREVGVVVVSGIVLFHTACGSSPTQNPTPTPTATTAPTQEPPPVDCPTGTLFATCNVDAPMKYLPDVTQAIDLLVKDRPEIFNLNEALAPGMYRILNRKEYRNGVLRNLNATGFCAESPDATTIQVKRDNDHSERYSIATASGHVRRDVGSHLYSCNPAAFPLAAAEAIDYIFVNFYTFECKAGVTAPRNMEGILPQGCIGLMTATPKDQFNKNVPPSVAGMNVRWEMVSGDGVEHAVLTVDDRQPYNVSIEPRKLGEWDACATVRGVTGCRHVKTVP